MHETPALPKELNAKTDRQAFHERIVALYRMIADVIETGVRADLLRQAGDTARRRGQVRGPQLRRLRKMLAARGRR